MAKGRKLDVKETCRKKLNIFYGSFDLYEHGFKECLANGKDIINKCGVGGELTVTLSDDNKRISVKDTGCGININQLDEDNEPYYKMYFETLFAGENMDNADEKVSVVGCNGCGTCVLNHISKYFRVESAREGKIFEVLYLNGGEFQHFKEIGKSNETYSIFEFELDEEVYKNTKYELDSIKDICKHNVAVENNIKLILKYADETFEWFYESIEDYFNENTSNKTSINIVGNTKTYIDKYIDYDDKHKELEKEEETTVSCIMATSTDVFQETYLNGNYLPSNGTIYDGFILGVRNYLNKYCKEKKLLTNKTGNISKDDIQDSISFICSVSSTKVDFENQTKLGTSKQLYSDRAKDYIVDLLEVIKTEQPSEFDKMVKHILEVQKFNNKSNDGKNKLKKSLSEKTDNLLNFVDGVTECEEHGENSELIVTEGDSAGESAKDSRNWKTQAVLGLRGKILNLLKENNISRIANNDVIASVFKALGCGVENKKFIKYYGEYNPKKLRFGRFLIATDFDADGYSIQCLILTMLYVLCPSLIKDNRVYIVKTPLYQVRLFDDSEIYWFSETEKEKAISNGFKYKSLSRIKGLGELDADVMERVGLNPETRQIDLVTIKDAKKMKESFDIWMATDVADRKAIIEDELNNYMLED